MVDLIFYYWVFDELPLIFIKIMNISQILSSLAENDKPLWFNRMLEVGADLSEPTMIETIIRYTRLPIIIKFIRRV